MGTTKFIYFVKDRHFQQPQSGTNPQDNQRYRHMQSFTLHTSPFPGMIKILVIWLAPWAGKNRIQRCDGLPERARWNYLALSGLPSVSQKKIAPFFHVINALLTKPARSTWLHIGLIVLLRVYGPHLCLDL